MGIPICPAPEVTVTFMKFKNKYRNRVTLSVAKGLYAWSSRPFGRGKALHQGDISLKWSYGNNFLITISGLADLQSALYV